MSIRTVIKKTLFAGVFFILGTISCVFYNQYVYYKWDMKFDILKTIHVYEQINQLNNLEEAKLKLQMNIACEVENYVMRNQEIGFKVDKKFVDSTLEKASVTCK